ncbi:hypothetical protein ERJ75_001768100 [Trypanosoma vivax]|uniref:Uncharacterized protein n=1 Tax=Trypanosoma vivax (strain Y486) TaxID=1055687 RepID=G0TRJ4_TRYVY|nr:hypothetical protein TRVL_01954 [Trypanosoma vivax]KAH8603970.1 hypothetical protein ERJ75_001768100 [Trypanosoma vivax]CCC46559.1 conserved hypothetical protein [Trypanosoma vivax Y486]
MRNEEEIIKKVVQLQRSSANFAEYCVAHATDPKHKFLFDKKSNGRDLYVSMLANSQCNEAASEMTGYDSARRARALWPSLCTAFSTPRAVRGPHMPHTFASLKELTKFVSMVEAAASRAALQNEVVQFMVQRLPMTETFLHVVSCLCDAYVHEARVEALHMDAAPSLSVAVVTRSTEKGKGGGNTTTGSRGTVSEKVLQRVGTLLFILNRVMVQHESMERPLRYREVFYFYFLSIVRLMTKWAPRESEVHLFVRNTVGMWSSGNIFTAEELWKLKSAVGLC